MRTVYNHEIAHSALVYMLNNRYPYKLISYLTGYSYGSVQQYASKLRKAGKIHIKLKESGRWKHT